MIWFALSLFTFTVNIFTTAQPFQTNSSTRTPTSTSAEIPKDANLNFIQLATKHGYQVEEHTVVTADGYILNIFRIPHDGASSKGYPILLVHGLFDTADTWILTGPRRGLGYILADAGYDVWFGNVRGNLYSRAHLRYNPDTDEDFWKYSFDDIGIYDLPASLDYILKVTRRESLSYVGHSQGTLSFFIMCSMKPEYNKKINLAIALAPIAWLANLSGTLLKSLSKETKFLYNSLNIVTNGEFFGAESFERQILNTLCLPGTVCRNVFKTTMHLNDDDQFDEALISVVIGHVPSGTSIHNLAHFGQLTNSTTLQRYDYGVEKNLAIYGKVKPPEYDLSQVVTPVALICGKSDWLSTPQDVETLRLHLKNVVDHFIVPMDKWNHLHHLWAKDAPKYIASRILMLLEKYVK